MNVKNNGKDVQQGPQSEGRPRNPYTYGTSPKAPSGSNGQASAIDRPAEPDRQRSVSFSPVTHSRLERQNSLLSASLINHRKFSPSASPHSAVRASEETELAESSADENTAIFRRRSNSALNNYGAVQEEDADHDAYVGGYDGAAEDPDGNVSPAARRRKGSMVKSRAGRSGNSATSTRCAGATDGNADSDDENIEHESWFKVMADKYGSVELENKGSVARDHLALGRFISSASKDGVQKRCEKTYILHTPHDLQVESLTHDNALSSPRTLLLLASCTQIRDSANKLYRANFPGMASYLAFLCVNWYRSNTAVSSQHITIK